MTLTPEIAMKKRISDYLDKFIGVPAAVLGGGPSLPEDMKKLPEDCILIAVNYHAFYLCQPDFLVYNDQPKDDPLLLEAIKKTIAIKVSSDPTSDVEFDVPVWTGFYSSNTAAWFALWLGCDPVILCGMDCYQGERAYFHEYEDKPHFHYPLEHHLQPWIEDAKNRLQGWERVKAMSGPLVNVFGRYEPMQKEERVTTRSYKTCEF